MYRGVSNIRLRKFLNTQIPETQIPTFALLSSSFRTLRHKNPLDPCRCFHLAFSVPVLSDAGSSPTTRITHMTWKKGVMERSKSDGMVACLL